MAAKTYDVLILGAGITGCSLGLILASQGIRTLIVDKTPHPRFALGESLLKPTVLWLRLLAARFGVEDLAVVANLNRIHDRIAPTSGVKKSFGFVRHRAGGAQTVAHWWANIAVSYAEDVLEAHLFRQDVDAYLYARAAAAGCEMLVGTVLGEVADDDGPLCVETTQGRVHAQYLVDCTGQTPTLPRLTSLREEPTRMRTNSRAIFTHMIGVQPFDDCALAPAPALPWHQGTLHHLLDGAWMWVIPFDNHPRSTNALVSVGVNFDNSVHPEQGQPPQEEWQALLDRYPALRAQFGQATAVRPWISTGRLQRSTLSSIGERCCLLGQAAGSVDALYSRGLLNTFQSLHLLAELLIEAVRAGDYARARFAPLERLQRNLLQLHDNLVSGSYIAFRSVPLTDWWLAIWSLIEQLSLAHVVQPLAALELADSDAWNGALAELQHGACVHGQELVLPILESANAVMDEFAAGQIDESAAAARLHALAAPLAPLGYDLDRFRQLTTRHGFSRTARRLLETEHALTAAVEAVDRHAGLPLTLRTSSFVNGLIRLLAIRYARTDEVDLAAPALGAALSAAIERVAIPGTDQALLQDLVERLQTVSLRRSVVAASPGRPVTPAGWQVLLECQTGHRYVGLRFITRGDPMDGCGAQLELVTEADGIRLVVMLDGRLPAAPVLAAMC